MEYIDNRLISSEAGRVMRAEYAKVSTQTTLDLIDILTKLQSQKNMVSTLNTNGKYTNLIYTLEDDIKTLSKIIDNNQVKKLNTPNVYGKIPSHNEIMRMRELNPSITSPLDPSLNSPSQDNYLDTLPVPPNTTRPLPDNNQPDDEIDLNRPQSPNDTNRPNTTRPLPDSSPNDNMDNTSPNPNNTQPTPPNTTKPLPDNNQLGNEIDLNRPETTNPNNTTTRPSTRQSLFRRYPMQRSSIISNLTKSILGKRGRTYNIDTRNNRFHNSYQEECQDGINILTKSQGTHPNNRYHNRTLWGNDNDTTFHMTPDTYSNSISTKGHDSHCDHDRKLATNQIDLIRLLLLFVALHPYHPHLPKICRIADNQMSGLLTLI